MSDGVNRSSEPQAAATASAPAKRKKVFLEMAPLQFSQAICSDCGDRMACVPVRDKKGRIEQNKVKFFCDTCECGFEAQLIYYNGMNIHYEDKKDRGRS